MKNEKVLSLRGEVRDWAWREDLESGESLESTCHRPSKYRAKFLMEKALGVRANQVMIKHMDAALETVSV